MNHPSASEVPVPNGVAVDRGRCPFDPPAELGRLRDARPLSRLTYPDGADGWLATGHDQVKRILADTRFSSRMDLAEFHLPTGEPGSGESIPPMPVQPGSFINLDPPDHTYYRRMLTGVFTVRRMTLLEDHITEIVEARLDHLAGLTVSTVDLVEEFALPIPSLVICELLGVPYAEREVFQTRTAEAMRIDIPVEQRMAAFGEVTQLVVEVVQRKRSEPGDDLLSDLIARGDLSDEELGNIGMLLLGAGFETTANMLALGTFALLENREQWEILREDPELIPGAVEELLRYLSIADLGARIPTEDIEFDGEVLPKHTTITVSIAVANRDPHRFPDPDVLDVRRDARGHLSFGHGVHQCLGQQLARVEMRIGFAALIRRFPSLRMAVPAEEVPMRTGMQIYGVHALPVTWDR